LAPRALAAPQTLGITERKLHRTHPVSDGSLSPKVAELFRASLVLLCHKRHIFKQLPTTSGALHEAFAAKWSALRG
ncbi:hypothetical protein, partial [Silanimonas sp.]|uniref:hypothetical protein n=1 Tax=Silanimonas sp. TaxID=1929290 RepID=UPI001BC0248D